MGCGVKDEKFYYFRFFLGLHEKSVYRGELSEKTGLGQFADLRGGFVKKRWTVFLRRGRGCYSNAHYALAT